jgi:hypothetical protein
LEEFIIFILLIGKYNLKIYINKKIIFIINILKIFTSNTKLLNIFLPNFKAKNDNNNNNKDVQYLNNNYSLLCISLFKII